MHSLLLFIVLFATVLFLRMTVQRIVVFEFQRGLKYRNGRFQGILQSGSYWFMPSFTTIRVVDTRPTFVSLTGQEVLSSDGVTLKVSLAAKYEVVDPDTAVNKVENYQGALYLELQLGLREIIGSAAIADLLENRQEFGKRLLELKKSKAEELGVRLLSVDVKDIMFPGELKKIFAQVVKARQEGLAALEKVRGETAALRNLANAAQLVEKNPTLMQLRLLQSVGESSGNTLVLGMPSQSMPLPVKAKEIPKTETRAVDTQEPEE